ncbi:MAG: hypothetical protein FJ358_07230 [Thaumarchaeota archaeon]|nr:hypothetical protein [Nitrososphaerota archaeon]
MNATKVVIDKDLTGWGRNNQEKLKRDYSSIEEVGVMPSLPQRTSDASLGLYCKEHSCDLLTSDKEAYSYFFDAGIRAVQISRYSWYEEGDKPVYLIKIVD